MASPAFLQNSFYSTMRAARYYGKEDIRIEQIEEPTVKAGQIKVRRLISEAKSHHC